LRARTGLGHVLGRGDCIREQGHRANSFSARTGPTSFRHRRERRENRRDGPRSRDARHPPRELGADRRKQGPCRTSRGFCPRDRRE
jgi:hypothetical protein